MSEDTKSRMRPINYTRIPLDEIEPEARRIAVAWCDGFESDLGVQIEQRQKLASDIMNYSAAAVASERGDQPPEVPIEGAQDLPIELEDYRSVSKAEDQEALWQEFWNYVSVSDTEGEHEFNDKVEKAKGKWTLHRK